MTVTLTYVERLRAVWTCTVQMTEAVAAEEWQWLEELIAERQQLIDEAGEIPEGLPLSEARLAQQLVQQMVDEDRRFTENLQATMKTLQGELQQATQARTSAQAYLRTTIFPQPQKARFVDKQR